MPVEGWELNARRSSHAQFRAASDEDPGRVADLNPCDSSKPRSSLPAKHPTVVTVKAAGSATAARVDVLVVERAVGLHTWQVDLAARRRTSIASSVRSATTS